MRRLEQNKNALFHNPEIPLPQPYNKRSHYPGNTHRLRDAAELGQLIGVKCNLCKRAAVYLASDLVELLHPEQDALMPPFACSRCGKSEFIAVKLQTPSPGDYGHLTIRRPGPVRRVQTWRSVKLGD